MALKEYYLSIWEIGHRWAGVDPNLTDPEKLPLEVQDNLRTLTRALSYEEFHVLSSSGTQYWNPRDIRELERYYEDTAYENIDAEMEEEYFEYFDKKTQHYTDALDGLEQCYKFRKYDKAKLEGIYYDQQEFYIYCKNNNYQLPNFWIDESVIKELSSNADTLEESGENAIRSGRHKLRDTDRWVCRALAEAFWEKEPKMSIAAIIRHPITQKYGNSNAYGSKNTVRDWIKDLDPRSEQDRIGAPKKKE